VHTMVILLPSDVLCNTGHERFLLCRSCFQLTVSEGTVVYEEREKVGIKKGRFLISSLLLQVSVSVAHQTHGIMGCAMTQAVSRRPLTAEARIRSRVGPCGICGGQSGTGTGFYPSNSVFPGQFHCTGALLHGKAEKTSSSS
jgi:hypothetical protein